jgi:hypothetical protein
MNDTAASADPTADDADDLLVAELRRVAGVADPVPPGWADAAHGAFAWATVPGVPARLTYDSRTAASGGRGDVLFAGPAERTVRFTAGAGPARAEVELELDIGADKVRVLGRVRPGRRATVVALSTAGRTVAHADDSGTFRVDELPRRPFCVVIDGPQPLKTGWVVT